MVSWRGTLLVLWRERLLRSQHRAPGPVLPELVTAVACAEGRAATRARRLFRTTPVAITYQRMSNPVRGSGPRRAPLYLLGVPGKIGGASTKIVHLIRLLHCYYKVVLVTADIRICKEKEVQRLLEPYGVPCVLLKELPKRLEGVGLALCEKDFFTGGTAREAKGRGLKLVERNDVPFQRRAGGR